MSTAPNPGKPVSPAGAGLLPALCLLAFCLLTTGTFLVLGTWFVGRTLQSYGWKEAQGRLIHGNVYRDSSGEGGTQYRLQVHYEYRVGTQRYRGSRWAPAMREGSWDHPADARRELARLSDGPFRVYYNPSAPQEATLTRELHPFAFLAFTWGWGFFLVFSVSLAGNSLVAALISRTGCGPGDPTWTASCRSRRPLLHRARRPPARRGASNSA